MEFETHKILSEVVAIYFENKMTYFLEKLGYNQDELKKLNEYRYIDVLLCSEMILDELSILDCYQRIGSLSLENYQLLKESERPKEPLCFENEDRFLSTCTKLEKMLEKGYQLTNIVDQIPYVLGVPLAFLCLN